MKEKIMTKRNETTESYLLAVPVPDATETYSPVPHRALLNELQERIAAKGLSVIGKQYYVGAYGQQMLGKYTIESGDSELKMQMAFRNSYDKSMAVGFAAGATVFVCRNGMLSGDMLVYRKHTGNILEELHDYMIDGINMMQDNFKKLQEDKQILKEIELEERIQAEILGRLYIEKDIITSTQLNIVKHELKHSENFVGKSAWNLYNNITEALKTSHVTNAMQGYINLHDFFTDEVINPEMEARSLPF